MTAVWKQESVVNLNSLLDLDEQSIDRSTICMMRHTPRALGDYLLDPSIFDFYTSVQRKGKLDRYKYVMTFIVGSSGKTIFRGMYELGEKSALDKRHYADLFLPKEKLEMYDELMSGGEYEYYSISKTAVLAEYDGRIVIDWGRAAIAWFQNYAEIKPKEVVEILPHGFFRQFEGFTEVSLTRAELEYLFTNLTANPEWIGHLSRVGGIYMILDEGTGQQYIGSASGSSGIWGRWRNYAVDPAGGNARLVTLLEAEPLAYKRFRYSIMEVMPSNSLKDEIVAKESLYKKKLGTRAFGLNQN
jgi:hypothetical protein